MIFYFSGTGNSLAAAKAVLGEGEELINMTERVQNRDFQVTIGEDENLGFVCPVYYGGLPSIVKLFLRHMELTGIPAYTYCILTCGGMACDAAGQMEKELAKQNLQMDAAFPVVMPDNYVIGYKLDSPEKQEEILAVAETELVEIRESIEKREDAEIEAGLRERAMTKAMYPFYVHGRKTKKFFTTDDCVGCGVCATRCPYKAIELKDGRPTWVKERCAQCMACLRCNAVQYGKQTIGRARYTHPDLRKKKKTECH